MPTTLVLYIGIAQLTLSTIQQNIARLGGLHSAPEATVQPGNAERSSMVEKNRKPNFFAFKGQ
jgi:hypothetical protein